MALANPTISSAFPEGEKGIKGSEAQISLQGQVSGLCQSHQAASFLQRRLALAGARSSYMKCARFPLPPTTIPPRSVQGATVVVPLLMPQPVGESS